MLSNTELVAFVKQAKAEGWGYVGGANGELYTPELAQKWADTRSAHSDNYYLKSCARWFGKRVGDCSGLIIAALRSEDHNHMDMCADYMYSHATEKGKIKTIPEIPGLIVWKKGHIGVYIGNGQAIESRGYKYGVVETKVTKRPWTHWGKLADVDYSGESEENEVIKQGDSGEKVYLLQKMYTKAGYTVLKPGAKWPDMKLKDENGEPIINGHDGSFGPYMALVTASIQAEHGLDKTGEADIMTMLTVASEIEVTDTAAMDKLKADNQTYASKINAIRGIVG